MKISCICGEQFSFDVPEFPNSDKDYVRKPCPKCRRSYEMTIRLVTEQEKFWKV